jgi:hypothetical protein
MLFASGPLLWGRVFFVTCGHMGKNSCCAVRMAWSVLCVLFVETHMGMHHTNDRALSDEQRADKSGNVY